MSSTILAAAPVAGPSSITNGDDGTLVLKTGVSSGSQVDAVRFAADGTATFLTQPVMPQRLTLGVAKAATGSAVDFSPADGTGVPSWAKRITIVYNGLSTTGSNNILMQIGAGSIVNTGYVANASYINNSANSCTGTAGTAGFIAMLNVQASTFHNGSCTIYLVNNNTWVMSGIATLNAATAFSAGTVTLSGSLDRVRLMTGDAFDSGTVNILYEG